MMVVVEFPVENSFDAVGCRRASKEIIKNFGNIVTNEFGKEIVKSKLDFLHIGVDFIDYEKNFSQFYTFILEVLSQNNKTIFLGGDHSISYFIGKSFLDICKIEEKSPFLIVFDAHPDCKVIDNAETEIPNNVQWLRKLVEDGFPGENIILVGLRSSSLNENKFLEEKKIKIYLMKNILDLHEICDIVMELANKNEIYISIDIDVIDGVFVPGTARPEPTGFTSRELLYFLQRLNILKNLRVVDICEINPDKDFNEMTVKLGTKILSEML